jgi:hypothetical protein
MLFYFQIAATSPGRALRSRSKSGKNQAKVRYEMKKQKFYVF